MPGWRALNASWVRRVTRIECVRILISESEEPKVDRTAFSVAKLTDPSDEPAYWASKTPEERLEALEIMRQFIYGYDPITERLQRVFEVVKRTEQP